jgi:hypothetical protein
MSKIDDLIKKTKEILNKGEEPSLEKGMSYNDLKKQELNKGQDEKGRPIRGSNRAKEVLSKGWSQKLASKQAAMKPLTEEEKKALAQKKKDAMAAAIAAIKTPKDPNKKP